LPKPLPKSWRLHPQAANCVVGAAESRLCFEREPQLLRTFGAGLLSSIAKVVDSLDFYKIPGEVMQHMIRQPARAELCSLEDTIQALRGVVEVMLLTQSRVRGAAAAATAAAVGSAAAENGADSGAEIAPAFPLPPTVAIHDVPSGHQPSSGESSGATSHSGPSPQQQLQRLDDRNGGSGSFAGGSTGSSSLSHGADSVDAVAKVAHGSLARGDVAHGGSNELDLEVERDPRLKTQLLAWRDFCAFVSQRVRRALANHIRVQTVALTADQAGENVDLFDTSIFPNSHPLLRVVTI
jgi:hypothetical protein